MLTPAQLLDAAKAAWSLTSDYSVAKKLKLGSSTVYCWRYGQSAPRQQLTLTLAEAAGIDPAYALACMEYHRHREDNLSQHWERLAVAAR